MSFLVFFLYQAALESARDGYGYTWVNFWYYTDNSEINLILAMWFTFAVLGLILFAIYPPRTYTGIVVGYLGCIIASIGYGLTVNLFME